MLSQVFNSFFGGVVRHFPIFFDRLIFSHRMKNGEIVKFSLPFFALFRGVVFRVFPQFFPEAEQTNSDVISQELDDDTDVRNFIASSETSLNFYFQTLSVVFSIYCIELIRCIFNKLRIRKNI